MKAFIIIGILFWLFSVSTAAQIKGLDELCASIKDKVVVSQNPLKITRQDVFDNDCIFQFYVKNSSSIRIRVDRYNSDAEALVELNSNKESFVGRDALEYEDKKTRYKRVQIDPGGFWDKAVAHRNTAVEDHFILLRRKKYLIVILANDFSVIKKTERLLRDVMFD